MSVIRHIIPGKTKQNEIELGLLQMQILWILNRKSTHGYELMKDLNKIKTTKITQGTLYPTLQRLLNLGLIKKDNQGRKIVYHITKKGDKTMKISCSDFCKTFNGIYQDFVCQKCKK
jgi:DNA-binding PadR family transcriptional regulator